MSLSVFLHNIMYGVHTYVYKRIHKRIHNTYSLSVYVCIHTYICSLVYCYMFVFQQNLFQPSQNQIDVRNEKQREMERAFERPFIRRSGKSSYALCFLPCSEYVYVHSCVSEWTE